MKNVLLAVALMLPVSANAVTNDNTGWNITLDKDAWWVLNKDVGECHSITTMNVNTPEQLSAKLKQEGHKVSPVISPKKDVMGVPMNDIKVFAFATTTVTFVKTEDDCSKLADEYRKAYLVNKKKEKASADAWEKEEERKLDEARKRHLEAEKKRSEALDLRSVSTPRKPSKSLLDLW